MILESVVGTTIALVVVRQWPVIRVDILLPVNGLSMDSVLFSHIFSCRGSNRACQNRSSENAEQCNRELHCTLCRVVSDVASDFLFNDNFKPVPEGKISRKIFMRADITRDNAPNCGLSDGAMLAFGEDCEVSGVECE